MTQRLTDAQREFLAANQRIVAWLVGRLPAALIRGVGGFDEALSLATYHVTSRVAKFDPARGAFSTWVKRLVASRLRDKLASQTAYAATLRRAARPDGVDDAKIDDATPAMVAKLRRALPRLAERHRALIQRHAFDGVPMLQIAAELGVSKQRVYQRWADALDALHGEMMRCHGR